MRAHVVEANVQCASHEPLYAGFRDFKIKRIYAINFISEHPFTQMPVGPDCNWDADDAGRFLRLNGPSWWGWSAFTKTEDFFADFGAFEIVALDLRDLFLKL